jgi:transcriptional regulator with XRE-family HTH domain
LTSKELRRLRRLLGLTQEQMARALGLKRNTMIRYEGGKRTIPTSVAGYARCIVEHGQRKRQGRRRGR